MIDVNAFADNVSLLLRTKFKKVPNKERPFDQAFTWAANNACVRYEERRELKRQVGENLRARPRSGAKKVRSPESVFPAVTMPKPNLIVISATRTEIILDTSWMGARLTFRRDAQGHATLFAHTGSPPPVITEHARSRANELFAECDAEVIDDALIAFEVQRADELIMRLGRSWRAIATRGEGTAVRLACIDSDGQPIAQSKLPRNLVDDARAFARQYFLGSHSLSFPGM